MARGSAPGEKRGGRKVGTPNKRTQDLIDILTEAGYCPAAELIRVAAIAEKEYDRADEIFDAIQAKRAENKMIPLAESTAPTYLKIMQSSASDLMQYKFPKRKAVEITGKDGEAVFGTFTEFVKSIVDKKK